MCNRTTPVGRFFIIQLSSTDCSYLPYINFPNTFPHPPESSGIPERTGKRCSSSSSFSPCPDYSHSMPFRCGPVPERWDRVYSLVDDIEQMPIESKNGNSGTKLVSALEFDEASLSEEELSCLAKVYETFKNETPSTISEISHQEAAWLDNIDSHGRIDYYYAFSLKAL